MIKLISLGYFFLISSLFTEIHAQSDSKELDTTTFELKVEVANYKSTKGSLYAQLFNENGDVIANVVQPMQEQDVQTYVFKDLKKGKYAIRVFHDKNDNGKLDTTFIGIPKERFGFSNNVMGKLGPPNFEDQLFEVVDNSTHRINLIGR
jgi:uncharacterized protein (DUF2141 family)